MKKTLAFILSLTLSFSTITVTAVSAEENRVSTAANPQTATISSQNNGTVYFSDLNVKTVYKVGEELDLTDGRAYAGGKTADGVNWDIFAQPLESDFFYCDISEFDNTKAGEYTITVYCKTQPNVKPASFTVTVLDDDSNEKIYEGGTVTVYQKPDKLVYKIGEEFDSTGGKARASGAIEGGAAWDVFSKPIESDYFYCDTSEFDNTKAGEYTIYVKCDLYKNVIPDSFTVTVEGETTTATTQEAPKVSIYGDANCDGRVDISDVTLIKCYMLNSKKYGISEQGLLNADVQEKGNGVNTNDIIMIQQFTLGIIKSFEE